MPSPLRLEVSDRIATLTLDRPDRLNALIPAMGEAFDAAFARVAEPDVRVLVLRGAGRAFCAGGDIAWMAQARAEGRWAEMESLLDLGITVAHTLATLPKPVVAVLHGPAAGAGLSLALSADLRVATPEAALSLGFAKIGLHPDWGGSVMLSRLVNPAVAAELAFFGDSVPLDRALALGLVNRVIPASDLEGAVADLTRRLAAGPGETFARIKATLLRNQGLDSDSLRTRLEAEGEQMKAAMRHPDAAEGLAAFLEKRLPRFN